MVGENSLHYLSMHCFFLEAMGDRVSKRTKRQGKWFKKFRNALCMYVGSACVRMVV